jgi:hypothetical protein
VTNLNYIQYEMKRRLILEEYLLFFSSHFFVFLSRMHIKGEYILRVFENKVSEIILQYNLEEIIAVN